MRLKPWGSIGWILDKIGAKNWHLIASSSFEDRCLGLPTWLVNKGITPSSATVFQIENPPSDFWRDGQPLVLQNLASLQALLQKCRLHVSQVGLNDDLTPGTDAELLAGAQTGAIMLDITTLPKRYFLFAIKRLMNSAKVKDLVVTYCRAVKYPEIALCKDALPPSYLPGYARVEESDRPARLVVGVGYVALSVEDILERAKHRRLDYVFPFPPASPAFRRNWMLLARLIPIEFPRTTQVHRIDGMDAFEVFERTLAWGTGANLDMLPLGPKPHALGMAMACLRLEGFAELMYAQPQAYRSDYSSGIALDRDGAPEIYAYCLKRDGKWLF
jgi:hypothetical protein